MTEASLDPQQVLGLKREQLPGHIAIIMDGNGRWARQRGLPRVRGHEAGSETVREIVTECARLGIACLTLYSFSTENWKRPPDEVETLMDLYARYLVKERPTIMDNNVRFVQVGREEGLPDRVVAELHETVRLSKDNTGLTLALALNYGSRTEIVDAVKCIAKQVLSGKIKPDDIDQELFARSLYTRGLPDPDLLIRTANERRISNFLLWQISYAEIYVTPTLWPDFSKEDLHAAIKDFAGRQRRFGELQDPRD
ncbi:MAG: isoprenyl transferase [Phycisphaerales bacterium]|nr:MAG: isoprenyl transferase [Phycisphaerales bacterium]